MLNQDQWQSLLRSFISSPQRQMFAQSPPAAAAAPKEELLPESSLHQPTPAMQEAVEEAKRRYPRIAHLPLVLTYNPNRDRNSETFFPNLDGNPAGPYWNVQMGREPYAPQKESWPELVALESLHALQETDPIYRDFTERVVQSYTPEQMARAQRAFARDTASGASPSGKTPWQQRQAFQTYLRRVDAPELIRGRLWGDYFRRYEAPQNKKYYSTTTGYTYDQIRLLDDLQSYLQSGS